ncbi:UDP-N-acetylenolpyruvoylglucosamine reductase [Candidatus Roizmanbacteria bacterium RIFCSPHIGHO2_12_FULL_41_11]|uniref:UDP-N-acetylenolpyruvoylglucosamine reductase n=1 Tax=Candidatus Roizmanbacteria bacterium RIFCSPHIGHO2_12_FULL_41_11 TaxID=1802052 RepID=A0A1F7I075_9BACT|nr:MAG: UDP-N-acetylenolpyruvoylglucosamine reductase [Candidatus Roizmanbacteria bacterium RIFCSPHIGHO2_12_FULL_41_11]
MRIQKNIPLKNFSNYRIGGRAKYFLKVSSVEDLIEGLKQWEEYRISPTLEVGLFILGGGTNILISDKGFDGLVIHPKIKSIKNQSGKESKSQRLIVGGGVLIEDLLNYCIENCLSGLEWAGGLPGTLGGAVRGNAGAFRGEIKDNVVEVTSLDIKTLKIKKRSHLECQFEYRSSVFKSQGEKESERKRVGESESQSGKETEVIVSAVLKLTKGNRDNIEKEINEKIEYRRQRHPLEYPNIGSIFKNMPIEKVPQKLLEQLKDSIKNDPFPVLPTAKLLAVAGLKGKKAGGAMVSWKHPNFIVNLGTATSEDVQKLINQIKEIIKAKYNLELEEEITYLN